MALLLDLVYVAVLVAVSPLLLWRMLVGGKYRTGWNEKFLGRVPVRSGTSPCLWFHAVSVGEVLQLEPVLAELRRRLPGVEFVISTTTPTGRSVAETKFPRDRVCYFPLDFSWAVREAMARLRPTAIVLVELELWPNFVRHARHLGIPLALINARVSERSHRGYARIRPVVAPMLRSFEILAAQNDLYAERLASLGAPRERLHVTGSIKFDRVSADRHNPKTAELRAFFGLSERHRVFIAGSTQHPEESLALDTYLGARRHFPELRLILVPRHKERFEEVARLVQSRGLPLLRRSQPRPLDEDTNGTNRQPPILLLDTLGELAACWGLANVAFVGGSLTNRGGQNMIEPAGYGLPVLFGPNTQNFKDVVELLLQADAARVVHDGGELTTALLDCLSNPDEARARGVRARQLVIAQQGATARTVELLGRLSGFREPEIKRAAA